MQLADAPAAEARLRCHSDGTPDLPRGGTGGIWKGVAALLPAERKHFGARNAVAAVDVDAKCVTLASGTTVSYDSLVSTVPLDLLLRQLGQPEWADGFTHSSSHIIGVGIRGAPSHGRNRAQDNAERASCVCAGPNPHGKKCWLYFPEDNCPFYRCVPPETLQTRALTPRPRSRSATVFSLYAQDNCPGATTMLQTLCTGDGGAPRNTAPQPGPYWSLMFEVSESFMKRVNQVPKQLGGATFPSVVLECLQGAINTSLLTAEHEVVSLYHRRLEHGYPTPSLGRDKVLAQALPWLRARGIWSRGRFGSYKYEVANQDHSLMLGVEAADNIISGTLEATLNYPNIVNGMRNTQLLYSKASM